MSEHPNATSARHMLEAFNAGRVDLLAEMYAEDGVMHLAGHNPTSGTYRGRAEIAAGLAKMYRFYTSGGAQMEAEPAESILASAEHMMMLFRARGQRDDDTIEGTVVFAATVDARGKYKELWYFSDKQAESDRFGS